MSRLLKSIDRWGPGLLSILTFAVVIALAWIYSSRLSYLQGQVISLNKELDRRQLRENQDWQLIETYRLEVQSLRRDVNSCRVNSSTN